MTQEQIAFGFDADLPASTAAPAQRRSPRRKLAPIQPSVAVPVPQDAEAMATLLDAHPDFRVQRRLQPCLRWPDAEPGHALCTLVLLDTETTGLEHSRDHIIEMALLRLEVDTVTGLPVGPVRVYDELEDPGVPISKEIQAITGISSAMVCGHRLNEQHIADMLQGAHLVVAHNAAFDRPFAEARIAGFDALPWACSIADIDWKAHGRSSAKLESLALDAGHFYDAHRAEMDCHALLAVLARALPGKPTTGLAQLIAQSALTSFRLQATGAPFDAKDKLKTRGYRWNNDQKVWHTRLADRTALDEELAWLKDAVYRQRAATVHVEELDALVRYSTRAGKRLVIEL